MRGDFESDDFVDLTDSDWGDSFDDSDGSSWEHYFDCESEGEEDCDYDDVECHGSQEDAESEDWQIAEINAREEYKKNKHINRARQAHEAFTTDRRISIIKWVYQLNFSSKLKENKGFFIDAGWILILYDGKSIEICNWLATEGILHGRVISGYSISHKNGCDKYPPRLFFYKINDNIISNVGEFYRFVEADDTIFTDFKDEIASILPKSFYQDGSYIDNSSKRQKDIFHWLFDSKFRINFHGTKSFAIKNRVVNLKSCGQRPIIDWLSEEGFDSLNCILGYVVKAYDKDSPNLKRLIFVKIQDQSTNLQER